MRKILILSTFLCLLALQSMAQYQNLVLEGAGIRGIAYTGALQVLEEKKQLDSLERIGGTSVGAIVGALLSVGYSAEALREIMFNLEVQTFNDGYGIFFGGQKRLRKSFGWYRGEKIQQWIAALIREKTGKEDLTFIELHQLHVKDPRFKDLYVTATNLTKQKMEIFSWLSYPNMQIRTAVRASISIPMYFTAVFLNDHGILMKKPTAGDSCNVFVDGGILANYPIWMFDEPAFIHPDSTASYTHFNNKTIGLKVERPEQLQSSAEPGQIAPFTIVGFRQYVGSLYNIVHENLNRRNSIETEMVRTVFISSGNISPRVRKISRAEKQQLYDNGSEAARHFIENKIR